MTLVRRRPYANALVLVAWLTVLWALMSLYFFQSGTPLPHVIDLAVMLSAAASMVGGCVGVLYLAIAARSTPTMMSGLLASALNFIYVHHFLKSLTGG
jgi:Na+/proline symporter